MALGWDMDSVLPERRKMAALYGYFQDVAHLILIASGSQETQVKE